MDTPAGHSESEDVAVLLADGPVSAPATPPASAPDAAETTEEEQLRHDEDGGGSVRKVEGEYAAQDYSHLDVSAEVRDLFQYISQYSAHDAELESTLKPFVPDYLPAVGQTDVFVKVQRPDAERDELGLKVLDEPDATINEQDENWKAATEAEAALRAEAAATATAVAEDGAHNYDLSSSSEDDDEAGGDGAAVFVAPVSESSSQSGRR